MNLERLKEPFAEDEIEWRLAQCGKGPRGIWAHCLAYVTGRAIMDRLDEVCGAHNWKASYRFIEGTQGTTPGVICELAIKVGDEWVTKEDGAEQTDIESFKGGISSALKRAGSAWGIGRYLYSLESGYAEIVDDRKVGRWGKTKDGTEFYWVPPKLPAWALPKKAAPPAPSGTPPVKPTTNADKKPISNGIHPTQPEPSDGVQTNEYCVPYGKLATKPISQCDPAELKAYIEEQEERARKANRKNGAWLETLIRHATPYIAAWERGDLE